MPVPVLPDGSVGPAPAHRTPGFPPIPRGRRHTRFEVVTGVQTCALPIYKYYSKTVIKLIHIIYDNHIAIAYYSNFTMTFSASISSVIFNYKSIIVKRVNKKRP